LKESDNININDLITTDLGELYTKSEDVNFDNPQSIGGLITRKIIEETFTDKLKKIIVKIKK